MIEITEDYPRGGNNHTNASSSKRPRKKKKDEDFDDFFEPKKRDRKRKASRSKSKKKKQKVSSETTKVNEPLPLSSEDYVNRSITLGVITDVSDFMISVSLPHNCFGYVTPSLVSDEFAAQSATELSETNFRSLSNIFSVGDYVVCSVKRNLDESFSSRIRLSLRPQDVNQFVTAHDISLGMVIYGVVSSKENHGYVVDIGLDNVKGFVKEKYTKSKPFEVCDHIICAVSEAFSYSSKIIQLQPYKKANEFTGTNFNSLLPGACITAKCTAVRNSGILLQYSGYQCFINRLNFKDYFDDIHGEGSELSAVIIFVNPHTKAIYCSLQSQHRNLCKSKHFLKVCEIGSVHRSTVVEVKKGRVMLLMENKFLAIVTASNAADEEVEDLSTKFALNQEKRCRVLKLNLLENFAIASTKPSVFKSKVLKFDDIKVGNVLTGSLCAYREDGILIEFAPYIRGFVPLIHISDSKIRNPQNVYNVGTKLKTRVLKIKNDTRQIILTMKRSLLKSDRNVVDTWDKLEEDMILACTICSVHDQMIFLASYGDIKGIVRRSEIGCNQPLTMIYRVGQTVDARLLSFDKIKQKAFFSFNLVPLNGVSSIEDVSYAELKIGEHYKGIIYFIDEFGLTAKFGSFSGLIPLNHLSDFPEFCSRLLRTYKVDDEVEACLYSYPHSGDSRLLFTLRRSFIEWPEKETRVPSNFEELLVGMVMLGVIQNITTFGIFIETYNKLTGLAHRNLMDVPPSVALESVFKIGQTALVSVNSINSENQRFVLSLLRKDVKNCLWFNGEKILDFYLSDRSKILECSPLFGKAKFGEECQVVINEAKEKFYECLSRDGHPVCLMCKDLHEVGETLRCYTVDADPLTGVISVSHEIDNLSADFAESNLCPVEILSVHEHFAVGVTPKREKIFIMRKKSLNEFYRGDQSELRIGGPFIVNVQNLTHLIGKCCFSIKEGDVAPAVVTEVLPSQINLKLINNWPGRILGAPHDVEVGRTLNVHIIKKKSVTHNRFFCECSLTPYRSADVQIGSEHFVIVRKVDDNGIWVACESAGIIGLVQPIYSSSSLEIVENYEKEFVVGGRHQAWLYNHVDTHYDFSFFPLELIPGKIFVGRILEVIAGRGATVELPFDKVGFLHITDVCDDYTDAPLLAHFNVKRNGPYNELLRTLNGRLLQVLIKSSDEKRILLSTRKSRFNSSNVFLNPEITGCEELEVGQKIHGFVSRIMKSRIKVSLSHKISGTVDWTCYNFPIRPLICVDDAVHCKILSVNPSTRTLQLSLQLHDTLIKKAISRVRRFSSDLDAATERALFNDKILRSQVTAALRIKRKQKLAEEKKRHGRLIKISNEPFYHVSDIQVQDASSTPKADSGDSLRIGENIDFDFDVKLDQLFSTSLNDTDSSETEEVEVPRKKKKKKMKHEEEKRLFELESTLLLRNKLPETVNDFERLVTADPDNSELWIYYVAFHLQSADIEKAHVVIERALKTINFRDEENKLNVWVCYLNFENMHGTPESLSEVLKRALQYNDQFKIYEKMAEIYCNSKKYEEADNIYRRMIKRFNKEKSVWFNYIKFCYERGEFIHARKLMNESFQSLSISEHVEILSRCAQMEFKYGEIERGKVLFEKIVGTYPKRTDIWSVYIDMLVKVGNIENAREAFHRATSLNMPLKKVKSLFKKFLEFENNYGNKTNVVQVKKLINERIDAVL